MRLPQLVTYAFPEQNSRAEMASVSWSYILLPSALIYIKLQILVAVNVKGYGHFGCNSCDIELTLEQCFLIESVRSI